VLQNLGRKLEEKFIEGEKEGIKKGKEKYYGKGIVVGECEEHKRWTAAGHGDHCFSLTDVLEDSDVGTQTDPPATTTTSISTQTNPTTLVSASLPPELLENTKKAKMSSTKRNFNRYHQFFFNNAIFHLIRAHGTCLRCF
jgi:hypothetical protein